MCVCMRVYECVCGYFLRRYYLEPINYSCTTDMTNIPLKMYIVKLLQSAVCSCAESEDIAKWRFAARLGWKWKCCKQQVCSSVKIEGVAKCRFAAGLKVLQSSGLQQCWKWRGCKVQVCSYTGLLFTYISCLWASCYQPVVYKHH